MTAWQLVTRREVVARITDKPYVLGTLTTVLLIVGFMGFTTWQSERTKEYDVAATPAALTMAEQVADSAGDVDEQVRVEVVPVDDDEAARTALLESDADAWLREADDGWELVTESSEESSLTAVVSEVVSTAVLTDNAEAVGSSVEELRAGAEVSTEFLRGDAEQAAVADVVGFAFVFLFYIAALVFGMQLANSVVEEKQSRIVEIIAAAIPLRHLLAGKVAGNTILAMIQVLVYVGVGLVGMSFTPYKSFVPDISGPILWFLGFFLAGFVALACLWAVAGALASRTEDLQSTSTPLTMLIVVMFFGGVSLDGRAETVVSFVPPVSAVVMPKRILSGGVEWWEPVLALGLLGVFAAGTVWVGERLYRRALLQTSGKLSVRQAWSTAE